MEPNATGRYTGDVGYGLIDTETANMVGFYATEREALEAVAHDVRRYGPTSPVVLTLALFRQEGADEIAPIAEGEALVARARASAGTPALR